MGMIVATKPMGRFRAKREFRLLGWILCLAFDSGGHAIKTNSPVRENDGIPTRVYFGLTQNIHTGSWLLVLGWLAISGNPIRERRGKICYTHDAVTSGVLNHLIPEEFISIGTLPCWNPREEIFLLEGYSRHFRPIGPGEAVPAYRVWITAKEDGTHVLDRMEELT